MTHLSVQLLRKQSQVGDPTIPTSRASLFLIRFIQSYADMHHHSLDVLYLVKHDSALPPAGWYVHVRGRIHRGAVTHWAAGPVRPHPDPGDPHSGGQERGCEDQSCH